MGVLAGLLSKSISAVVESNSPDLRAEWLCWCGIFGALRIYRYHTGESGSSCSDGRQNSGAAWSLGWKLWISAVCLSASRIIGLYFDVNWSLPLVTSFVYSILQLRSTSSTSVLPLPALGISANLGIGSNWPSWVKALAMTVVGCSTSAILYFAVPQVGVSYPAVVGFMILRTAGFVLLSQPGEFGVLSDNERSNSWNLAKAEELAFRVLSIVTILMVIIPSRFHLSLATFGHALFSALEVMVILFMISLGYCMSATTLETLSATTLRGFMGGFSHALPFSLVSVVSAIQCQAGMPLSSRRQGLLLTALVLLPSLVSMYHFFNRFSHGTVENLPIQPSFSVHPIEQLAQEAQIKFGKMIARQSKTLQDATTEYMRRYNRSPPPHFDTWFEAARSKDFLLIDEFDIMMKGLEPFWGVSPADLRGRVDAAIATGEASLIRVAVKDHRASYSMVDAAQWVATQVRSWFTHEMLATLPDLALVINSYDEPKMVVPHDILQRALSRAHSNMTVQPGQNPKLAQEVHFLDIGRQNPWDVMVLSCPTDSPARQFYQHPASSYMVSELGFLSNVSASKDICLIPELRNLQGFLNDPETLHLAHSLFPVFSTAKLSSFQDILYPAPWYDAKVDSHEYNEQEDTHWEDKEDSIYWVGSTTGGHATVENWRFSQRQRLALMTQNETHPITLLKRAKSPRNSSNESASASTWEPYSSKISEISPYLKVRISSVIQCDDDACRDQEVAFNTSGADRDSVTASYRSRYNLDLDGNGLSGRFYRLLRSNSAVLKQTIFQEWHDDWLVPWVHYIPVNMNLTDFPEIARYLVHEPEGRELGKRVARDSTEWVEKIFRKQDFKLVFWRLLLEYGRVMHDDRSDMKLS
ncbi:hypothetical protein EMPG_09951 [Blastomyces silverae]|uniref:Glycosyl transferase CAP10 domain-containing protein n=1 Tax=Blastomyces silverae TaxID=2060906 RepID=A0A0H1BAP5_9EURO|nr:hypothetical protein EMPG_09951 [Blastomyces silverae]